MKIQKIALSILAIAISSSAFASSYPEQIQKHKEEIQAKLNSSSYDAVTENAAQNIYDGLKGSSNSSDPKDARMLVLIKSNGNSAYTYKVYSEQESKAVQDLSDKLSESGLSDDIIYKSIHSQLDESRKTFGYDVHYENRASQSEISKLNAFESIRTAMCEGAFKALKGEGSEIEKFNNLPAEISGVSVKNIKALKASMLVSSCAEINPITHKIEVVGLQNTDAQFDNKTKNVERFNYSLVVSSFSEMAKRGLVGSLSFAPSEVKKFREADSSLRAAQAASIKYYLEGNLNLHELELDEAMGSRELFGVNLSPVEEITVAAPALELLKAKTKFVELIFPSEESVAAESNNAKLISEFNALQELALKESDPAVKNLIKQAADLKLASYTK